ncbi:MAG: nuclease-related domain-containing protein [Chloroflexia bacterium]
MAVQVWVGEVPDHPQEREAIVALARGLARLEDLYLILANFTVGGQAIDLAIFKRNGGFVIELKHCDGKVVGGVNGKWQVIDANGEVHILNPDRRNPYNQVISYFYRLSNFLNQHRREFLSEHRAQAVDFRTCKRLVVISPSVHPDSEIVLDWKVDLKGLDELPTYLVTATSSEIDLTEEELLAIPRVLRCEPWHDVNLLVGDTKPTDGTARAALPAASGAEAKPWRLWQTRGSIVVAALILLLLAGLGSGVLPLLWRQIRESRGRQPPPTIVLPTVPDPRVQTPAARIEVIEQAIERESAYAGGRVEVVLRSVEFLPDRIVLHWALFNHGTRRVSFPLTADNIVIEDNILNAYSVDDALSEPRVLVAQSGERVEGSCTVSRAISPDAMTLRIYVQGEPFEGRPAVWLANIPGRE